MPLEESDIAALAIFISAERLAALSALTGSARAAIELHQDTLRLGAALMHVTGTIEIALRNAVCENLNQHFVAPNWLLQPPAPFTWRVPEQGKVQQALSSARRSEYAKLSQAEKAALDAAAFPNGIPHNLSHANRSKRRQEKIPVSTGKIVAELTLFFWKRLYGPEYEHNLWRTTLKRTFPDKSLKRATVATHLERVYQSRNRLAHHEPVVSQRFLDTIDSVNFILDHLGPSTPGVATPLRKLLTDDVAALSAQGQALHDRLDAYRVGP